jgi:hypothetical protein
VLLYLGANVPPLFTRTVGFQFKYILRSMVADPHHFNANPDPDQALNFAFNADPDPTSLNIANPGFATQLLSPDSFSSLILFLYST